MGKRTSSLKESENDGNPLGKSDLGAMNGISNGKYCKASENSRPKAGCSALVIFVFLTAALSIVVGLILVELDVSNKDLKESLHQYYSSPLEEPVLDKLPKSDKGKIEEVPKVIKDKKEDRKKETINPKEKKMESTKEEPHPKKLKEDQKTPKKQTKPPKEPQDKKAAPADDKPKPKLPEKIKQIEKEIVSDRPNKESSKKNSDPAPSSTTTTSDNSKKEPTTTSDTKSKEPKKNETPKPKPASDDNKAEEVNLQDLYLEVESIAEDILMEDPENEMVKDLAPHLEGVLKSLEGGELKGIRDSLLHIKLILVDLKERLAEARTQETSSSAKPSATKDKVPTKVNKDDGGKVPVEEVIPEPVYIAPRGSDDKEGGGKKVEDSGSPNESQAKVPANKRVPVNEVIPDPVYIAPLGDGEEEKSKAETIKKGVEEKKGQQDKKETAGAKKVVDKLKPEVPEAKKNVPQAEKKGPQATPTKSPKQVKSKVIEAQKAPEQVKPKNVESGKVTEKPKPKVEETKKVSEKAKPKVEETKKVEPKPKIPEAKKAEEAKPKPAKPQETAKVPEKTKIPAESKPKAAPQATPQTGGGTEQKTASKKTPQPDNPAPKQESKQTPPPQKQEKSSASSQTSKTSQTSARPKSAEEEEVDDRINVAEAVVQETPIEALNIYGALLRENPRSPRVMLGRAKVLELLSEREKSNARLEQAIHAYRGILDLADEEGASSGLVPGEILQEASIKCATTMIFRGFTGKAMQVLKRLLKHFPSDADVQNQIGLTYFQMNQNKLALQTFKRVLEIAPENGFAMAHYGLGLKMTNGDAAEAVAYLEAGMATGEEGTQDKRFFYHVGDSLQRMGRAERAYQYYDEAVLKGHFLGRYQRSLYNVDRLVSKPVWSLQDTPAHYQQFFRKLESNWQKIRDEMSGTRSESEGDLMRDDREHLHENGRWSFMDLFVRGKKNEENCARMPFTCALIEEFASSARCSRGQVKLSVLQPKTHLFAHSGPTNCRLRAHLGLVTPDGPVMRVVNETLRWKEGEVLLFDDSFEHEVWHEGGSERVILIVDVWHPDLGEEERQGLRPI